MESPDTPDQAETEQQRLENETIRLEHAKLNAEIQQIITPAFLRPSTWFSVVAAIVAISGVFFQYTFSKHDYALANIKKERAQFETCKAEEAMARANDIEQIAKQKAKELQAEIAKNEQRIAEQSQKLKNLEEATFAALLKLDPIKTPHSLEKIRRLIVTGAPIAFISAELGVSQEEIRKALETLHAIEQPATQPAPTDP